MPRYGRQTPTLSLVLPYQKTLGSDAVTRYNDSGRTAQEWQEIMMFDILAVRDDGLYVHAKYGYSIPRRNGKGEVLTIRELFGLEKGEHILHTAHRTATSSSASKRLAKLLKDCGYEEIQRVGKDTDTTNKYSYSKQFGLERITLWDTGGICEFRTRTSAGGLGEGFDLLVIDEAQEYTTEQESTLKYTVSDSKNPQTILCGTPPTAISQGTVFVDLRTKVLSGEAEDTGWAEWSVREMHDPYDIESWYECNPSMGYVLTERAVRSEIGADILDHNIQRLGYWHESNQKSAITEDDWKALITDDRSFTGKLHIGIQYSKHGGNVALAVGVKLSDGKNYVEVIDCRPITEGNAWILSFLSNADWEDCIIDGASGENILKEEMKDARIKKKPILATVDDVIQSGSMLKTAISQGTIQHSDQTSVRIAIGNCQERAIGTKGGFSYECIKEGMDTALIQCVMLAHYLCAKSKIKKHKQTISF